jgi:hypothetical protein
MTDFKSSLGPNVWSASRFDDLICPRRYYYARVRDLRSKTSSVHAHAGKVIHVGLDVWYSSQTSTLSAAYSNEEALLAAESAWGDFVHPPTLDPKKDTSWLDLAWVSQVLCAYFDRWAGNDPWEVVSSEEVVVREVANVLYGGRRDLLVREPDGAIWVLDHKSTTGNMGDYWFGQFAISNQMRGYVEDYAGVIINGMYMGRDGIAGYHAPEYYISGNTQKKKRQRNIDSAFQRKAFTYPTGSLAEWEENVGQKLQEVEWRTETQCWPQETSGGICRSCDFRGVCGANPRLREGIIASDYEERTYEPR